MRQMEQLKKECLIFLGNSETVDEMILNGFWCPFNNVHMGELTDRIAKEFAISREEEDEFAFNSNKKGI